MLSDGSWLKFIVSLTVLAGLLHTSQAMGEQSHLRLAFSSSFFVFDG